MKILFFGNICAGKSSLAKIIGEKYKFDIVAIDDFRRIISDGSIIGERNARLKFISSIDNNENQIIECLGVGAVADAVFETLSNNINLTLCFMINAAKSSCLDRLKNRIWDVPFPKPPVEIFTLIDKADLSIASGEIIQKWKELNGIIIYNFQNNTKEDFETTLNAMSQKIELNL